MTVAFGRARERARGRGNGHGRERERCGAARGVARGIQATRGRTGRQVAWRHGRARAPATRLADWRQEDDGAGGLVQLGRTELGQRRSWAAGKHM